MDCDFRRRCTLPIEPFDDSAIKNLRKYSEMHGSATMVGAETASYRSKQELMYVLSDKKCANCGLEAQYYAREVQKGRERRGFITNLYGVNLYGEEVRFINHSIEYGIPRQLVDNKDGTYRFTNNELLCEYCYEDALNDSDWLGGIGFEEW